MEGFKQWVEGIHFHALDRLKSRLARWPDIFKRVEDRTGAASLIYNDGKSWAIQVDELPDYARMSDVNDGSNGDMVVIIVRPDRYENKPEVITGMLRRSPDFPGRPQPFTPDALRVDRVARLPDFTRHLYKFVKGNQTMRDVA